MSHTFNSAMLRAYFVCGSQDCVRDPLWTIEQALQSGVTLFQLREKGPNALQGEAKRQFARQVQQLCRQYGVSFLVNDDIELAIELDADGIHIGQDDLPIATARQLLPNKIIGLSVGTWQEYDHSDVTLADYIGVGPIYATQSKIDATPPIGTTFIHQLRHVEPELPMVAIGGIRLEHIPDIVAHGANGVAVISLIAASENIPHTVQTMLDSVS